MVKFRKMRLGVKFVLVISVVGLMMLVIGATVPGSAATRSDTIAPRAHWRFDEGQGTSIGDDTGNGNTGNLHGVRWLESDSSKSGTGLRFNGDDHYALITHSEHTMPEQFTITLWLRLKILNNRHVLEKGGQFDGNGYSITTTMNGHVQFSVWSDNASFSVVSNEALNKDWWYHVAGTFDGSLELYINSVMQEETRQGTMSTSTAPLTLGRACELDDEYFGGRMDELYIFNEVLNHNEIHQLVDFQGTSPGEIERMEDIPDNVDGGGDGNGNGTQEDEDPSGEGYSAWNYFFIAVLIVVILLVFFEKATIPLIYISGGMGILIIIMELWRLGDVLWEDGGKRLMEAMGDQSPVVLALGFAVLPASALWILFAFKFKSSKMNKNRVIIELLPIACLVALFSVVNIEKVAAILSRPLALIIFIVMYLNCFLTGIAGYFQRIKNLAKGTGNRGKLISIGLLVVFVVFLVADPAELAATGMIIGFNLQHLMIYISVCVLMYTIIDAMITARGDFGGIKDKGYRTVLGVIFSPSFLFLYAISIAIIIPGLKYRFYNLALAFFFISGYVTAEAMVKSE